MDISSLVYTVQKSPKPVPPAADEYGFSVDRKARKILGALSVTFGDRESVRVRTNVPFTWSGEISLPDTSIGELRQIRCRVELSGMIQASEAKAREYLTRLLECGSDADLLVSRSLAEAIKEQRIALQGAFVDNLRRRADDIYSGFVTALRTVGFPAERIKIGALSYDTRETIEFADETTGVSTRTLGSLEANRFLYKARLVWGREPEQVLARLAYTGSVDGVAAGAPLANPLVPGQIQPAEAFFRQRLAIALGQEELTALAMGEPAAINRVKASVSPAFGRGTGRVIDTLIVYMAPSNAALQSERSARCRSGYTIMGIAGDQLEIEHRFTYSQIERDRWMAQGSPDPEAYLRDAIIKATEVYLNDKTFEQVVSLYLDGLNDRGANALGQAISGPVDRAAARIGFKLISVAFILSIPQHEYLEGKEIRLADDNYQLADANLRPRLAMTMRVRVKDGHGRRFAGALARREDFEKRLRSAANEALRTTLRMHGGLDYYSSPFVNHLGRDQTFGVVVEGGGPWVNGLKHALQTSLDRVLEESFGLERTGDVDLTPGEDRIIARMQDLLVRPKTYEHRLEFNSGYAPSRIIAVDRDAGTAEHLNVPDYTGVSVLSVSARVFIAGLAANHWPSFYYSVDRISSVGEHVTAIKDLLTASLNLVEPAVTGARSRGAELRDAIKASLENFLVRLREDFGLEAHIHSLRVRVNRPRADRTGAMILHHLHSELNAVLGQLKDIVDNHAGDALERRNALLVRVQQIRQQIRDESDLLERDTTETEIVEVSQDRATGPINIRIASQPSASGGALPSA